jgi:hypothetical protein
MRYAENAALQRRVLEAILVRVFTRVRAKASRNRPGLRRILVPGCLGFETAWIRKQQ